MKSTENSGNAGAKNPRQTGTPAAPPAARPTPRMGGNSSNSGKHPLPSPWPQQPAAQPFPEAEDVTAAPTVGTNLWLADPEYWLADHQRLPRPPTRPIPRPQRFRPKSYLRSALLAVIILIVVMAIGAGMVMAGRVSYQFFNAPAPIPTTHPASSTPTHPAKKP